MSQRFKGSRSRVDRAAFHVQNIVSEWKSLFEKDGFSAVATHDKDSGWYVAKAVLSSGTIDKIAKNNIALEVGEAAYQLRAALDGLIWEAIAITQGAEPPADANRLDFPILNGKNRDFKQCGFHKFPFPDQLRDWLESIQPDAAEKPVGNPDRGLKTTLEDIHDLARMDRHRRLRMVTVSPVEVNLRIQSYPFPSSVSHHEMIESCDLFSGQYDFVRFKLKAEYGATPYKFSLHTNLSFEVQVEGIEPYEGEDIGTQILRFMHAVDLVIAKFETLVP